jgi:hypothetical protein
VEKKYCPGFSVLVTPTTDSIYQFVKQSDEAESVYDKCAKGYKRGACDRMEEALSATRKAISRSEQFDV